MHTDKICIHSYYCYCKSIIIDMEFSIGQHKNGQILLPFYVIFYFIYIGSG